MYTLYNGNQFTQFVHLPTDDTNVGEICVKRLLRFFFEPKWYHPNYCNIHSAIIFSFFILAFHPHFLYSKHTIYLVRVRCVYFAFVNLILNTSFNAYDLCSRTKNKKIKLNEINIYMRKLTEHKLICRRLQTH